MKELQGDFILYIISAGAEVRYLLNLSAGKNGEFTGQIRIGPGGMLIKSFQCEAGAYDGIDDFAKGVFS